MVAEGNSEEAAAEEHFLGNAVLTNTHDHNVESLTRLYQGFKSRSRPLREITTEDVENYTPSNKYEWLTGTEIEEAVRDSVHSNFGTWILTAGHGKTGALRPTGPDRSGWFDRQRFGGAMRNYLRERHYRLAHVTPQGLMRLMAEEGYELSKQREMAARAEEQAKKPKEKAKSETTFAGAVGTEKFLAKVENKSASWARRGKQRHYHPSHELVTEEEQLRFYALYQQAVKGPCIQPEPPAHEADAVSKWKAHKLMGDMSKAQAEEYYGDMLKQVPTCLLLGKIYEDVFESRSDIPSGSALCTFATDPGENR